MKKAIIFGICMLLIVPVINATIVLNNPPSTPTKNMSIKSAQLTQMEMISLIVWTGMMELVKYA